MQPQPQPQMPDFGEQPISDEKRRMLSDATNHMQAVIEDTKMRMNASKLNLNVIKKQRLNDLFSKMKSSGVDLNNRESVASYISKLRQNNPETADMFEKSMNYLLTDEGNNMNNINQNEALPQNPQGFVQ